MSEKTQDKQPVVLDFAQLSRLIINDLSSATTSSSITANYTKEQIVNYMKNPNKSEKQLREISNYFYNASPNYKRLILYFANLPTFDFIVEPFDLDIEKVKVDRFKKQYNKTLQLLELMNIPHEFLKILKISFREDAFYGYEHTSGDSYFIQKLNPDLCKISSIEDGVYNFAFDFSYFDSNKDKLNQYPSEFKNKYDLYEKDRKKRWQELDSENTICIKINEDVSQVIPPFANVFESIFDIDESKGLKRVQDKMDNYMILTQQIPVDEKSGEPNKFLIDLETAIQFHNKVSQSLPKEVGLATTPMKLEGIKLDKKTNEKDSVAQAERNYYNASGVSQFLFNSDKATSLGLSMSVKTDEQLIYGVLRQLERWVNRKLKYNNTAYKFRVKFLNITVYNAEEVFNKYLKAAERGLPVKSMLGASLGLSPSSLSNMAFLENEILNLHESFIPLSSTHTSSGKEEAGREKLPDNKISESGDKTRANDGNIRG